MESKTSIKTFNCRAHPDEIVQRVSLEEGAQNPLMCIECVLAMDDKEARSKLLQFKDYTEKVIAHYNGIKDLSSSNEEIPSTLTEFLSKESEAVANLTSCVENEKKRVVVAFNQISEAFNKLIESKKTQLLKQLDDQVLTLTFNYKTYRNKIEKFYKGVNEISETDLPKFVSKINAFDTTSSLENFLKAINNDMAENASLLTADREKALEEGRKGLKDLSDTLKKQSTSVPTTVFTNQLSTDEFLKKVSEKLDVLFEEAFEIKDNIEQFSGVATIDSKILKKVSDISMLRKWVAEKAKPNFKLLYRGSRDGFTSSQFHSKCNNKGPTVVIIRSNHGKVFGAFTDKDWTSNNNYQNTNNSFLFSIDKKGKYPIKAGSESNAMYCYSTYGPTFGGGHDFYICDNCNTANSNYSNFPYSYVCTEYVNSGSSNWLAGAYNFKVEEIEVFSVQKK